MLRALVVAAVISGAAITTAKADFDSCKESLKGSAIRAGVSETTAAAAFDHLAPDIKILDLESFQPEFKTPIWDYLSALVDDQRVLDGRAAMADNAKALGRAEKRFGVDRFVIAAIWGVESDFGREMGDRPLVQSLATLSCMSRRRPGYFRDELMAALTIADHGDIPLTDLKGSWAGAFGQTQFMPSTFLRLAVNLDGSGKNLIDNPAAALGSTANYLKKSGWITGEPWGFEVQLPPNYAGPSGRKNFRPMTYWASQGVRRIGHPSPSDYNASLLLPAGPKGPAFLVTHNFNVIYSYNAAESYALAIAILAQRLSGESGIVTAWPTDDPGISRAERKEVQQLLSKRGYDVGPLDGAIGEKTRAAIVDVQRQAGLDANGRASKKILDLLRR